MANINIAVVPPQVLTSGNNDFTVAGFGTPKAAMFFFGMPTALGSLTTTAKMSIGFTDGTNQYVASNSSRNAVATTNTKRRQATDEVVMELVAGTGEVYTEAAFSSWITNGVRIATGAHSGTNRYCWAILFSGSDLSAKVGNFQLSTQDTQVAISGVGFEPDVVLFTGVANVNLDTVTHNARMTYGVACNSSPIAQRGLMMENANSAANVTLTEELVTDGAGGEVSGGAEDYMLDIQAFDSDGFDAYARNGNSSSDYVGYLALKFGGNVER
jgi:hypothetical protein